MLFPCVNLYKSVVLFLVLWLMNRMVEVFATEEKSLQGIKSFSFNVTPNKYYITRSKHSQLSLIGWRQTLKISQNQARVTTSNAITIMNNKIRLLVQRLTTIGVLKTIQRNIAHQQPTGNDISFHTIHKGYRSYDNIENFNSFYKEVFSWLITWSWIFLLLYGYF